ncbi:hypothetical protein ACYCFK_18670 [Stutzerimonas stutzeri]
MGIYTRYTTAFLILLVALATASTAHAATLHPVPGIARALAAGPTGVMPSGLTVQRSQQLGVMLLKANTTLALGGGTAVTVTRGASLSVGGLARGAVTVLKNSSPPKLIGSAVIATALASIPGAKVHEGEIILAGEPDPTNIAFWAPGFGTSSRYTSALLACRQGVSSTRYVTREGSSDPLNGTETVAACKTSSGQYLGPVYHVTLTCPYGNTGLDCNPKPTEPTQPRPFSDADWDALEAAIPSSDPSPSDVSDFWFNLCGGIGSCMGSYTSDPTLTGPTSVQGPQSTTTSTGPNGTTTTTKDTQHDLDYSNPDGVVVRDRTTTTKKDPDGTTTTDTTKDTGPVTPADPAVIPGGGGSPSPDLDGTFSDTPFPEIEPFYQQKYPDGLQGAWNSRKAEFEDSAFMEFLSSFIPSFSGSCPGWSMNVNIASWASFGIHEFQSLCWVFDFIKVVMLLTAAFLCRALIFGG